MYPIDAVYEDYLKRHDRQFIVSADIDGVIYDNTSIIDFSIENSLTLSEEFEIGTAIPSKLTIRLRTQDVIPPNARITPYLAMETGELTWNQANYPWDDADIAWAGGGTNRLPLGVFYVDSRERINDVWTYTCYDRLVWGDGFFLSSLTYPATQQAVWNEICTQLGYTYDSGVVINPSYTVPVAPTGYSRRQVMGFIAASNAASVYARKDGVLTFKRFGPGEVDFELTASDYIRVVQTNPVKTYTRVVVTADAEDDVVYEAGEGDENHTLYVENPFATQSMTNALLVSLSGFSYQPITMDSRGFPHFDQGDEFVFEKFESRTWIDTMTPWEQTDTPWDGLTNYRSIILHQRMDFKGGLRMSIEAPSLSEQQSEFPVPGPLTEAINNLNKTAVKEGKLYYGASLTREEGLTIDRSDGKAKAVFNADELSFYRGSERALWFDVPSDRYKFSGTLEGVNGTFSGTVQGGSFLGGSIQIGTAFSVNSAGHMVAVGGEFSGTITAAVISGGQINGTTIVGGVFKTATTGRRIEISSNGFGTFDANGNNRIAINTSSDNSIAAISFFGPGGAFMGEVNAYQNSGLTIFSNNLLIGSNSTANPINFQGAVSFNGSVTGLNLSIGQINGLQNQIDALWNAVNSKASSTHTHTVTVPNHNHGNPQNQTSGGGTFTTSGP